MQILNEQRGNGSANDENEQVSRQSMIDISDLQSDIFILKFLLGGTKQNQEREKYQHDSYKLSLTSI